MFSAGSVKKCCFKNCEKKGFLDDRIEIKTVSQNHRDKEKEKYLVKWHSNGEAEFHVDCWDKVFSISRSRPSKKIAYMPVKERELVKTASKSFEQFDSISKVLEEAKKAAEWIKNSKRCVAFTGAGISTSAGIGDYRGKAGKWTEEDQNIEAGTTTSNDEPPTKKMKLGISEDVEDNEDCNDNNNADSNENDALEIQYENLRPTYTHESLYKLMTLGYLKGIISQNCDGLHSLSGVPEDTLYELHGNVFVEVCEKCGNRYHRKFYVMDDVSSQYFEEIEDFGRSSVKKPKFAVKCKLCGLNHRTGRRCDNKKCRGHLNDTIINFCDNLEEDVLEGAETESGQSDLMLCLGTTLQVTPASTLVEKRKDRCKIIACNRQETLLDNIHQKKEQNGAENICRVFGDCDVFMQEVMKNVLTGEEYKTWDAGRQDRMQLYDSKRDPA